MSIVVAAGVLVSLVPDLPPSPVRGGVAAAAVPGESPVPVSPHPVAAGSATAMPPADPVAAVWPSAGSAVLDLGSASPDAGYDRRLGEQTAVPSASGEPGGLPVTVRAAQAAGVTGVGSGEATPAAVRVSVVDRSVVEAAGVRGVLLSLARADGASDAAQVAVSLGYAGFAGAFGGGFGARLRLVRLPGCVLSTPGLAECRQGTPVPSSNDPVGRLVSAPVVELAAATSQGVSASAADDEPAAGGGAVLALTSGSSSELGDYRATSLAPAMSWSAGGSGGDFGTAYPIGVPPVAGGLAPDVTLRYSSGSVDGRNSATNAQPSWIGEGWDYEPGYVEAHFRRCRDDGELIDDLCFDSLTEYTMVWNGRSSRLVRNDATGTWRASNDDGARVEPLGVAADGRPAAWRVTTVDGTQFRFGFLDGSTASQLRVRVYGNDAGEPCRHSSGQLPYSYCDTTYRWNLDNVVDPSGNTITYSWVRVRQNYGAYNNTVAADYDLYGVLDHIDYGANTAVAGPAAARVVLARGPRCLTEPCFDGSSPNWYDTPWDLNCPLAWTSCPGNTAPTFWSSARLVSITTQVADGAGGYTDVDRWNLVHAFPGTGDGSNANLWLSGIVRTGLVGGTLALPEVHYHGSKLANRVYNSSMIPMWRYRITVVSNGAGGETHVGYSAPECTTTSLPLEYANERRCFPVYWNNGAGAWNWFHKYVVTSVTERDLTGGGPDEVFTYGYLNSFIFSDTKVAWRFDTTPNTPIERRTWGQWRGYNEVTVTHGAGTGAYRSQTRYLYHRGLNGDFASRSYDTRTVRITDGVNPGVTIPDDDPLQGFLRTQHTVDVATGAVVASTVTEPHYVLSAYHAADFGKAWLVRDKQAVTRTLLATSGAWRWTRTATEYDITNYGLPVRVRDYGEVASYTDAGPGDDDRCTELTYAQNTTTWMLAYPQREAVTAACTASIQDSYLSGTRTHYDGLPLGGVAAGLPTRTELLQEDVDGRGRVWTTVGSTSYDVHGRPTDVFDGLDRLTTTRYTPAAGGPVTGVSVTNPAGHVTTTTVDRRRAVPLASTDPNGKVTTLAYDPLGRLTRVWLPGRATSGTATVEYAYTVRASGANAVTTRRLGPTGNQITSFELFDGRYRPRQAQTVAPDGKRVISDTRYDHLGQLDLESTFYNGASGPTDTLVTFTPNAVQTQVAHDYDSLRRETSAIRLSLGVELWRTSTAYDGDRVTVDAPVGGTDTTAVRDARGRTVALRQYHADIPGGVAAPEVGYDSTSYSYGRLDRLLAVTDPAGNDWTYSYDLRGRRTGSVDPDAGTTTTTYDNADQLSSTSNARGVTLAYAYDSLGRRTAVHHASLTGFKHTQWIYDTVAKGQLSSTIRWHSGQVYRVAVTGYDDEYRPLGTTVTIPASETGLGGSYTSTATYHVDGSPATQTLPAVGGLPAETLTHTYDPDSGLPTRMTGTQTYLDAATYHFDGQPYERLLGAAPKQVRERFSVDPATRRLVTSQLDVETPATPGTFTDRFTTEYNYDAAGNVTVLAGRTNGVRDQVECFRYDHLRRLAEAWTEAFWSCATPQRAGADPYWLTWTHDVTGNRTGQVEHTAAGDVTTSYTYPAPGSSGPHTLTGTSTTGPAGTSTASYGYDAIGQTTSRPGATGQQTLDWQDDGGLRGVTENGQRTEYLYDADGNRLIRRDPAGKTLYLPFGTELRVNTAGVQSATRYYSAAGSVVAVRTAAGLTWLHSDHHGTHSVAVNADTLSIQRRRSLPYGQPRGTPPAAWPGERGFLGAPEDPTGLTHLGAREYDPVIGRFLSPDPLMDLADPQSLHGYAYANNSPATMSDPDGLCTRLDDRDAPCVGSPNYDERQAAHEKQQNAKNKAGSGGGGGDGGPTQDEVDRANEIKKQDIISVVIRAGGQILLDLFGINDIMSCIGGDLVACAWTLIDLLPWTKAISVARKTGKIIDAVITTGRRIIQWLSDTKWADDVLRRAGCNSFVPGTLVLMADGSAKPIEEVEVGDRVVATDPETGRTEAKTVTATIVGTGDKELVDIAIDTDGGDATAVVTATDGHPFWVPELREWIDAADLTVGQWLQTAAGTWIQVTAITERYQNATVHNLTIDDIHTYYVLAGNTPVLVHNSGPFCGAPFGKNTPGDELFHGTDYSLDEMTQFAYGHSGAGNPAMGRPSLAQIEATLRNAGPVKIGDQNAASFDYNGVRVIINYDQPWKSTTYFPGSLG